MPALLQVSNKVGFTKPPRGKALWFGADVAVRKQDEIVAPTTMGNTTTETLLGSLTIPPLAFTGQGGARATVAGTVRNATSTGTFTLRSKLVVSGSTVTFAQTPAISLSTSTAGRTWTFATVLLGTTMSTELQSLSMLEVAAPSTNTLQPSTFNGTGTAVVVLPNSTASITFNITAQLSAASTGFGASLQNAVLETLA